MFSLGSVFYCCLAGHPPFRGKIITALIRKIASQPHVPLRSLRPGVDPALASRGEILLSKDPARRGGGPRWLRRRLREYLADRGEPDPVGVAAGHVRAAS